MKILWISHLLPYPPKGGVMQRAYHLIRQLARYHEVYVLGFYQNALLDIHYPDRHEGIEEGTLALKQFCKDVLFLPIPCEVIRSGKSILAASSFFSINGYTVEWLRSSTMKKKLNQWASLYQFDLIHFDTISLLQYRSIFRDMPFSVDHHNIESHMMLRRAKLENNLLKKIYFYQEGIKLKAYERKHCKPPAINLTCSDLDSERLRNEIPDATIYTIPNGVDIEYFSPSNSNKKFNTGAFTIIFVGRLNAYTNSKAARDLLFNIWPLVAGRFPNAKCIIAGSNPPPDVVQASKHLPNVHITGYVDDVRPLIDQADIYLCPITDGGGTKLKVLDALAMGKPLIADPIACEGIDVTEGRNVLYAASPDEYLQQIERILCDSDLAVTLATEGRRLVVEKYSYEKIGRTLSLIAQNAVAIE